MQTYLTPLLGGVLIGLASWLMWASLGKITGISGITHSAVFRPSGQSTGAWRWAFLLGLVVGGAVFGAWLLPHTVVARPMALLISAGLLVGFGTILGSGCTSGHGVCGLGRRSLRSFVAVCVFMFTGFVTVWLAAKF